MLLLESCPSYQSRPSTMTRSMHLFLTRMGRHTRCKIAASRYYNTLHDSRMAYPTQRNVQCCQQDGRLNYNLIIKRTPCFHYHACRQWLSRVVFLDSEHFVLYSAGILLNGYNFHGSAWPGAARPGKARHGLARRGGARQGKHTASLLGVQKFAWHGAEWRGVARPGSAGQGKAWLGTANTLHPFWGCRSLLGMARRGTARRGEAGHGVARRGKANTLRSTERSS